jgi:ABC-type branched-subunit amino acid transport system ATPase component/MFS family permease
MPRKPKQAPEELVEKIERTRDELRDEARVRLGVTGEQQAQPLRDVLSKHGLGLYPLAALGVLSIVDTFQGYAFGVLVPDISDTLGIGRGAIAAIIALQTLANSVAPLPVAAMAQRRARRALLIVSTGIAWSLIAATTGFVTSAAGLLAVLVLDGLTTATVGALHAPFLLDSYPPEGRVRVLSFYRGANSFGNVLAPLLVAAFSAWLGLTWRGVFVVLGLLSLMAALSTVRLRDPGFGRWDTEQVRDTVRRREGAVASAGESDPAEGDVALGFFEIVHRLLLIRTIRRLLWGYGVFGVLLIPYQTFLAFFLVERWNLGAGARGLFVAFLAGVSIAALALFGRRGEALFRQSPARVVELAATVLGIGVALICLAALMPAFVLMVASFGLAAGMLAVLGPALSVTLLSVIPARMRPHGAALIGIALGAGGLGGALLLGGIDRRFGISGTIASLVVPGMLGALVIRSAGRLVPQDLDRMIDETIEDEEIRQITTSGAHLPLLKCRRVNFAYGPLQVLFDVDFSVDDGEMVALLGTNGAGKSTLLKVISGIGLPFGGSVRYRGLDITYLDAERRLRLGITQVPGGRAVFGPMTVVENLRLFGHTLGRSRGAVEGGIERSFELFPRLGERRNQRARTLSGGEQQMLGLAKALVLRPRLLLVDELSLGLAPVIVSQLLDTVREINRDGTAVVLVEQSVNIALGLVDHAYFMEKGEIRFDGSSSELLARGDLLRAVFLRGAGGAQGARGRGAARRASSAKARR